MIVLAFASITLSLGVACLTQSMVEPQGSRFAGFLILLCFAFAWCLCTWTVHAIV